MQTGTPPRSRTRYGVGNMVAHIFSPDAVNQMIPAVQRFLPVAWYLTRI